MNEPINGHYQARLTYDGMREWVVCPWCGKKSFPITPGATIRGQLFKCKGSNCKQLFEVNYECQKREPTS